MKKHLLLSVLILLTACGGNGSDENETSLLSKFKSTWNIHEKLVNNDDGSITYTALPWGGLVGIVTERNMPVDWSGYESITFEFANPTTVETQIMISDKLKRLGRAGITSLTCDFDGQDVSAIDEVGLQAADTTTITITKIYLTPTSGTWQPTTIWEGECVCGNWEQGFSIDPEKFADAKTGDKLEFIYTTDKDQTETTYWVMKSIYAGTEETLEGNKDHLNQWGCAALGKESTSYRITLTAKDIVNLQKTGIFVNGYYCIFNKCNLLRKQYMAEQNSDE